MVGEHADVRLDRQGGRGTTLKRRGILAAAGAIVAGIAAKRAASPAAALTDTVFVATGTATNFLAQGNSVVGFATMGTFTVGVSGTGSDNGVYGFTNSNTGVYGETYSGVSSKAMHGKHLANGYGVYGESTTTNGYGVHGVVPGGNATARGVNGYTGSVGYGVFGANTNGIGVYGQTTGGYGVQGVSTSSIGVRGDSSGGHGVYGLASAAGTTQVVAGVFGDSTASYGVIGRTTAAGYSGITGITTTPGAAAFAGTSTVPGAYAAYFQGLTVVQGDFVAFGGGKSAAVPHTDGSHRLVYCVESPEAWFEDFGKGQLVNGSAAVKLDADFAAIVRADDYLVFLTPEGDFHAHVAQKTAAGFSVRQTTGTGSAGASGAFAYRVVAKRKDIKAPRLAKFALPKINHPDPDKLLKPAPAQANPAGKA